MYSERVGLEGKRKEKRPRVDDKGSPTSIKRKQTHSLKNIAEVDCLSVLGQGSSLGDGNSKSSPQNNLRDPLFAFITVNQLKFCPFVTSRLFNRIETQKAIASKLTS